VADLFNILLYSQTCPSSHLY